MSELVKGQAYAIYLVICGHPDCENTWESEPLTISAARSDGATGHLIKAGWRKWPSRQTSSKWYCPDSHKKQSKQEQQRTARQEED